VKVEIGVVAAVFSEIVCLQYASRTFMENMNKRLSKYNIIPGTINKTMLNADEMLKEMDKKMIGIMMQELYEETADERLNPEHFFNAAEIRLALHHKADITPSATLPYTFESKFVKVDDQDYVGRITGEELLKLVDARLVGYNFEAQRNPVYKNNSVVMEPSINKKSVTEISGYIGSDHYLPDTITLNIYSEQVQPYAYNEKKMTFTVNRDVGIDILDGFHRIRGLELARTMGKSTDVVFNLALKSYDNETARRYFARISKINPVSKARIAELEMKRSADRIVGMLQKGEALRGWVASSDKVLRIGHHYTTTSILAEAIHLCYEEQDYAAAIKTYKYLEQFFNYLMSYYAERLQGRDDYFSHPLSFAGFVYVSKFLQEHRIEVSRLNDYVDRIDFRDARMEEIVARRSRVHLQIRMVIDYVKRILLKEGAANVQ